MILTRKTQILIAGAAIALIAAYVGYGTYAKRSLTQTVTRLVADGGERLGAALAIEADPAAPDAAAQQARLDAHVAAVERHLAALRALDAARVRPLADNADEYLHTSLEILRRKAASHRHRLQVALSTQALREHMRGDNRSAPWITGAIRAKERMDKDYRDYRLATEALAQLMGGYPISRRRIAEHLDVVTLPEDAAVEAARARALESAKHIGEDVEAAGRLNAYR